MTVANRPIEAAIAEELERRLLAAFWAAARDQGSRLQLLLAFTCVVVRRPQGWDVEAIREAHLTNHGAPDTVKITRTRCFACEGSGQLYAHHVIEIQYGGSNAVRNQVPLCFDCHQYLHPWLTDADRIQPVKRSGFESLGEVMRRLTPESLIGEPTR